MYPPFSITHLTLAELDLVLKNIRLGQNHLKKYLTPDKFQELINSCSLGFPQYKDLDSTTAEKTGNAGLVLNTIITGLLGSWLGLMAFIGFKISSVIVFIAVLSFSLIFGGSIGYLSYKKKKDEIYSEKIDIKLLKLELDILQHKQKIFFGKKFPVCHVINYHEISFMQWIKKKTLTIVTELFPTLLGTFGSMFVFLTGLPSLGEMLEFNINFIQESFNIKITGMIIAITITLIISLSSMHAKYKTFCRQLVLNNIKAIIKEIENIFL